jgi:hypothetical protein
MVNEMLYPHCYLIVFSPCSKVKSIFLHNPWTKYYTPEAIPDVHSNVKKVVVKLNKLVWKRARADGIMMSHCWHEVVT